MTEKYYQEYFYDILRVIEALIVAKQEMTGSLAFGLKNVIKQFNWTHKLERVKAFKVFCSYGKSFLKQNKEFYSQIPECLCVIMKENKEGEGLSS